MADSIVPSLVPTSSPPKKIKEIEEAENAEILYSNEHGFVAKINR